jgi:tricorn protease
MTRKLAWALALLLLSFCAQAQTKLLRYPTYSKGKVAFSYLGDIWIANENGSGVQRLTDNQAREIYPRFSPDGSMIAFSSNREGNYDVFTIPSAGGKPKQLTFNSANDTVVGWTPDGKKILFASSRGEGAFPTVTTLWEVPVEGGIETAIPSDWGINGSYSPDGSRLAFNRHPSVWSRQHYRGAYAADLWIMDVAAKKFTRLGDADYKGNYLWPMYATGGQIYFVSDRTANEKNIKYGGADVMKSVNNIWKISERGGAPVQVTHHTSGNLYFPSISADGKTIVYEEDFGLWKLDVATGKSTEISIDIKSDSKENDTALVTLSDTAEAFNLSPSNRRGAISVHGEIFTIATDRGEPQRVTESPWREQNPRWSPNGKWIAFVSDRTGREEIWMSDELGKSPKQLSDVDCDKSAIAWAADSQSLFWNGSDKKLRKVNIDTGATEVVVSNDLANITGFQVSPDGKYLAYAKADNLDRSHVWIRNLGDGSERMIVSEQFQTSSGAKWTPDGKTLLVLGGVGVPSMASTARGWSTQLYAIPLTPVEKNPDTRDIDTEAQAETAAATETPAAGGRGGRGGAAAAAPPVEVKIDWDNLERRIKKLTNQTGSVTVVVPAPDSHSYAFMAGAGGGGGAPAAAAGAEAGPGLYVIGEDGSRVTRLDTTPTPNAGGGRGRGGAGGGFGGGEPQWTRDGRTIYILQGGGIYAVSVPASATSETPGAGAAPAAAGGRGGRGGAAAPAAAGAAAAPGAAPRRVTFTVRMVIDRAAERQQVFEEAWRVMKNRFYDANMHGVDWAKARQKYEPLLPDIADTEELQNVLMEMIGELDASHTGVSGGGLLPGETEPERVQTRYPGFTLVADSSGYFKVGTIYSKGPANHDYIKLAPGNFVLSVNGKALKTTDNYWQLFNILPGRKFEFQVNSQPSLEGAWTIEIEPLTSTQQGDLDYEAWVQNRKDMVEKLTNGEIGYLHIRAMDAPSLDKFEQDLMETRGKRALIIDERFNGGGGIDQELLEILNQRRAYQATRDRNSQIDVPRPVQAFFGPMVVIQNERSASDAEMFPDGFRRLGLGKVVGTPTMGAVIGTGSFTLLDGEAIRTPGSEVITAGGDNMENYGVQPDIFADNGPEDYLSGHDRQIEKAIETLRSELSAPPAKK